MKFTTKNIFCLLACVFASCTPVEIGGQIPNPTSEKNPDIITKIQTSTFDKINEHDLRSFLNNEPFREVEVTEELVKCATISKDSSILNIPFREETSFSNGTSIYIVKHAEGYRIVADSGGNYCYLDPNELIIINLILRNNLPLKIKVLENISNDLHRGTIDVNESKRNIKDECEKIISDSLKQGARYLGQQADHLRDISEVIRYQRWICFDKRPFSVATERALQAYLKKLFPETQQITKLKEATEILGKYCIQKGNTINLNVDDTILEIQGFHRDLDSLSLPYCKIHIYIIKHSQEYKTMLYCDPIHLGQPVSIFWNQGTFLKFAELYKTLMHLDNLKLTEK